MQREEKSERSRRQVLDAALQLFSHQGYRATTVRDIADAARVSTGNVYHHFPDKESIFRSTCSTSSGASPRHAATLFTRALSVGQFPDNIEQLGLAARESIREFKPYFVLIFVDVIEFEGTHIRKFYGELGQRFGAYVGEEALGAMKQRLRPQSRQSRRLLITSRVFFNYFTIEILFNVPEPFGKPAPQVIKELSDIVRNGILM